MRASGIAILLLANVACSLFAQNIETNPDYKKYHLGIIKAEEEIFIKKNVTKGLETFQKTFSNYDFVFVDDCIEALQLALYFNRQDYGMSFIKRALDNGFQIEMLKYLTCGCPCDFYKGLQQRVTICNSFIESNKEQLIEYSNANYERFRNRIDKNIFQRLIACHVKDQLFKTYRKGLMVADNEKMAMDLQRREYLKITNSNNSFIDSLAQLDIFIGERNLGIYTEKLANDLRAPVQTTMKCAESLIKNYGLPSKTYVSITTDEDYFNIGPAYNILYHNLESFRQLSKYHEKSITLGYLHPREYASLMSAGHSVPDSLKLYLTPSQKKIGDTRQVNEMRKRYFLPSYQLDSIKHSFAHEHNLKLQFGYFNGTR